MSETPKDPFPAPRSKTLQEILYDLRQPIPRSKIKKKDTGKYKADFIPHYTVRDLLDYYAPGWESDSSLVEIGGRLYVRRSLTIHGSDGSITRVGLGNESDNIEDTPFGDPSSNADAMALRRAAMELGLGRELWRK